MTDAPQSHVGVAVAKMAITVDLQLTGPHSPYRIRRVRSVLTALEHYLLDHRLLIARQPGPERLINK